MSGSIEIRFLLFADAIHYSEIPDRAMPGYVSDFLGGIADQLDSLDDDFAPVFSNTWGDAILLVFQSAEAAGTAALEICDWIAKNPFQADGMRHPLGLRIGMHAGPVLCSQDRIMDRSTFLGSHINRAARIEPITEQGQIFVSREFAALAEMEGVTGFRCIAQGLADLPKSSGRISVYRLEKAAPAAAEDDEKT